MTEEEKSQEFPIEHSACPACGSTRRVADVVKQEEVAKGKIRPEQNFALSIMQAAVSDPAKPSLVTPVVTSLLDVCADCGCVYSPITTRQEVETAKLPFNQRRPQAGPLFGN